MYIAPAIPLQGSSCAHVLSSACLRHTVIISKHQHLSAHPNPHPAHLLRMYEAVGADKQQYAAVRKYCMHMVADHVTHVAVALPPALQDEDLLLLAPAQGQGAGQVVGGSGGAGGGARTGVLPPGAAGALRRGTFWLLGPLGPGEWQHLHMALAPGFGGARRGALQALRKEWESGFKFTGKV